MKPLKALKALSCVILTTFNYSTLPQLPTPVVILCLSLKLHLQIRKKNPWKMLTKFLIYLNFSLSIFIQVFLPVGCIFQTSEMNKYRSVASCIVKIGRKELFCQPTVALNIQTTNQTANEGAFFDEMLKQLAGNEMPLVTLDATENYTLPKASYIIVNYFKDCEAIRAFDFAHVDKNTKYIFLLESSSDCSSHLKGIGDIAGESDISTFVNANNSYNLYTYIPYIDHITCKVTIKSPLKINTCFEGELATVDTFPSKVTTNLKKCLTKVGIGPLYPFAIIEDKESLQTYDPLDINRVKGVDLEMLKILFEHINATLDLYYIFKLEENPYLNMEYIPLLLNGSLEICAGGLYRIYGDVVEYSGVYAFQSIMWMYYAERMSLSWENMALSIDGLYIFLVILICYSVVWCVICAFDKRAVSFKNTLLYSWGALVGATSLGDAKSFKQKILNIVYQIMCLHLSVYIGIQLYSFLTIQAPPQMFKTNEEILESGRTVYARTMNKYFIKDEKFERFVSGSVECFGFKNCSTSALINKGVSMFISGHFIAFQAATAVNDEARVLRPLDNLLTVYYEMIIRKESPLVLKFKKTIVRLFEAGIVEKLYNEAVGLTVIDKAKIATKNMMTSSYACQAGCRLNLFQFYGVFYAWSFGCLASVIIFTVEVLSKKCRRI